MAKAKGISRSKLNNLVKQLPLPVQEHLKRCRQFAEYLVQNISTEEWFLDLDTKPEFFSSAVFYHDIGKLSIPLDNIYLNQCRTNEAKSSYRSHTSEGVRFVEGKLGVNLENFDNNTFEHVLWGAIEDHHEMIDGSGFPGGKKDDVISLAGKITAIVDTFDNMLFFLADEKTDFEKAFADAMDRIIDYSGTKLDEKLLIALIKEPQNLRDYVDSMGGSLQRKRKTDKFGIRLRFHPVLNSDNKYRKFVCGYVAETVLYDPYFGIVEPKTYSYVAEKTETVYTLEKIAFDKLCALVAQITSTGAELPVITFNFSYLEFTKPGFYSSVIEKSIRKHNIDPGQLCIGVKEADIVDFHMDPYGISQELHVVGTTFALSDFGSTQASFLSSLDDVQAERVITGPEFSKKLAESEKTFDVGYGMTRITGKLGVELIFTNVTRKAEEEAILQCGGRFVSGPLYSKPLSEKELADFVRKGGKVL